MATIVVDELITKLDYQHDDAVLKQASAAVKQLESENKAAAESADQLAAENRKLAEQTDALTRAQIELSEQIAESSAKTDKLVAEQKALKAETKQAGKATDEQTKRLAELDREIATSKEHTKELRTESARLGREKQKVSQESRKVSRAQADVAKSSRKAAEDQRVLKEAMRGAAERAREEAGSMTRLAEQIQGIAGGQLAADALRAVGGGVFELGRRVIETGSSFESLRARLKTVEGSSEGAAKAFDLIRNFAKTTPFELEEVTTAFVRLKSLGLDASQDSLTAFGNIAAAQGKTIIDFIEAVADASTGEFERLKEFGIKASKQGEQVTFTFKGQQTVVKNTAKDIQAFLKGIGQTDFAGAMSDQMATTSGAISNFKDTISQALDAVAQQGPLEEFNKLLAVLSESIAGDSGLGKVIADVLVIALKTVRELFEGMPSGTLTEFLQSLVTLIGMVAEVLTGAVTEGAGFMSLLYEFATILLDVAAAVFAVGQRLSEATESLGGMPGPLDLVIGLLELMLQGLELWATAIKTVLDWLDPLLTALENLGANLTDIKMKFEGLSSLDDVFAGLSLAARDFAGDIGLVNSGLDKTASVLNTLSGMVDKVYAALSIDELTKLMQEGDVRAEAEIKRRQEGKPAPSKAPTGSTEERAQTAQKARETREAKAQAAALKQFEGEKIKDASAETLNALIADPNVPEKERKRAEKELARRERAGKAGRKKAAKAVEKSLLTTSIEKQLDELAEAAGQRAAARAIKSSGGQLSKAEINKIELTERKRVKGNLARRYEETGQLPPGVDMDLRQTAALPNIEQVGGRLAPPVITVNNQRIEVTGNTFEANVTVAGPVNATPQQVANSVVSQAQPVTFQGLARAIQNAMTNERR